MLFVNSRYDLFYWYCI